MKSDDKLSQRACLGVWLAGTVLGWIAVLFMLGLAWGIGKELGHQLFGVLF